MKTFYDYLNETMREYKYRIRTVQVIDEDSINKIEYILAKYDLVSTDGPKKTIMQVRPLDFVTMPAAEVYILDITTRIPISSFILQQELCHVLNIPQSFLIVRGDSDPSELQIQNQEDETIINDIAAKSNLATGSLLSSNPAYPEYVDPTGGLPIAGQEYNNNFLKYLAKVAADRIEVIPPIDPTTYNKYYNTKIPPINPENYTDDVVPVVVKPGTKIKPPVKTSPYGNFDDSIKTVGQTYLDKNGKKVLITAKKID